MLQYALREQSIRGFDVAVQIQKKSIPFHIKLLLKIWRPYYYAKPTVRKIDMKPLLEFEWLTMLSWTKHNICSINNTSAYSFGRALHFAEHKVSFACA